MAGIFGDYFGDNQGSGLLGFGTPNQMNPAMQMGLSMAAMPGASGAPPGRPPSVPGWGDEIRSAAGSAPYRQNLQTGEWEPAAKSGYFPIHAPPGSATIFPWDNNGEVPSNQVGLLGGYGSPKQPQGYNPGGGAPDARPYRPLTQDNGQPSIGGDIARSAGAGLLGMMQHPLLLGAVMNAQQPLNSSDPARWTFPQPAPPSAVQGAPNYEPHSVFPFLPAPPAWMRPAQNVLRAGIRPIQNGLDYVGSQIMGPRPAY